jgi:cation transport protein ChaC
VWVFAFGSLIWNPAFHHVERRTARIHGYHREFCLWVRAGRGSVERPGLMLSLESGGSCTGVAYRLAPGTEAEQDPEQLQQAIEASRALLPFVETALGPEAAQLRDALSQLQMAYARAAGPGAFDR